MTDKKWRGISVPREILSRVEDFVEKSPKYQTPTEFARHALIEKLEREDLEVCTSKIAVEG